jgi:hypothetical protein
MDHIELPGRLLLKSAKFQEKNVSFKTVVQLLKNNKLKKTKFSN